MLKGRKPTKKEKEFMNKIISLGCCVCRNEFGIYSPAVIHHLNGKTRKDAHFNTIGLCPAHHTDGPPGVAFHATGKKTWEARYGTQKALLEQTEMLINEKG